MKLFRSISALFIMMVSLRRFNPKKQFRNKRVAIIGAASSILQEEKGDYIDNFDIVIRINKAGCTNYKIHKLFSGEKCTHLFHSFYENEFSGGGPLEWDHLNALGIKKVINPNNSIKGLITHLNFYKRHLKFYRTYILKARAYSEINEHLEGWIPTVGFSAIISALKSPCREIYLTGFTFFKSSYIDNYRDDLVDMDKNEAHIKKQGLHNPDLEFEIFKKEVYSSTCKKVTLDKELQRLLAVNSTL
ncbi:glycosyltransferase family 29 protein [Gillisia sp. M10.2A]|uniref:Glycosyltransferase family 29 protein n=1 Tax=Gillisia lutea TaxID=2909668 RepID=A0ABS9EMJ5_9FLAO|nr:glycosyltransferase family 29 protein [Gillisia lutea]MCF4102676.1 glycosyltransferase family 29 protein [Gillisia lutea]